MNDLSLTILAETVNDALPITGKTPSRYRGVACDEADCGVLSYFPFDVQSFSMAGCIVATMSALRRATVPSRMISTPSR